LPGSRSLSGPDALNVPTFDQRPSLLVPEGSVFLESVDGLLAGESSHLWWVGAGGQGNGEPVLALRLTRFANGALEGGSVLERGRCCWRARPWRRAWFSPARGLLPACCAPLSAAGGDTRLVEIMPLF